MVPVVIDTNVLISALRSRNGASFRTLKLLGTGKLNVVVSVPLVLEYESVAKRQRTSIGLTDEDIENILDYACSVSRHQKIFYLWRPYLADPKDDMVLEPAVASEADFIITHNLRDFEGIEKFEDALSRVKDVKPEESDRL